MKQSILVFAASVLAPAAGVLVASRADASYVQQMAQWRAQYEASLKSPDGWLSVAGLFWLKQGRNTLGSDPHSDIALPDSAPAHAGSFEFRNGKATFEPAPGTHATVDGKPAVISELKPDVSGHADVLEIGGLNLTVIQRGEKTGIRLRDPNAETRRDFTGSKWFPADPNWRIQAKWVAYPQPKKIAITNILGMTDQEPSPGYAEFTISGKTFRLEPVTEDDELFFMFKDATSGKTTYGSGRFLYASMPKNNTVELDFNKAHNPPCAFTAFATCPLPPKQNVLPVAIPAGEKSYGRH